MSLCTLFALLALALLPSTAPSAAPTRPLTVAQCAAVRLQAAWLADASPRPGEPSARGDSAPHAQGPGFWLTLINDSDRPIQVAQPFPSSVHWFAEGPGGRLLWRASSGEGGALVDALRPGGPLFASLLAPGAPRLSVPAHDRLSWAEPIAGHPALEFRPGCQRCRNPEDRAFRAVLAYALVPPPGQPAEGLLPCGLRSQPLVMPPLP